MTNTVALVIGQLLCDDDRREALGQNARRRMMQEFNSPERIAQQYEELYVRKLMS